MDELDDNLGAPVEAERDAGDALASFWRMAILCALFVTAASLVVAGVAQWSTGAALIVAGAELAFLAVLGLAET